MIVRVALTLVFASALAAAHAENACNPAFVVEAEPSNSTLILLPARIGQHKISILLDTGSNWSLIKNRLVNDLALNRKRLRPQPYVDVAGGRIHHYVTVPNFALGPMMFSEDFVVLPDTREEVQSYDAAIGAATLSRFDVEIDNAARIVKFHQRGASCRRPMQGAHRIPFSFQEQIPELGVTIDGKSVRAVFDTGASRSVMSLKLARRLFGITPDSPGVSPRGALTLSSGKPVPLSAYTFKQLNVAGFAFDNVEILLADVEVVPFTLGMSEIKRLHVFIAFERRIIDLAPTPN